MTRLGVILTIVVLILATCASAGAASTLLILNSQSGDYIGGGITQTFTPGDGTFAVNPTYNGGAQVSFQTPNFSSWWYLDFGPPSGQALKVGEYEGAQRFAFHSPTRPGIDVSGNGRGCNTIAGRFLVSDITFAPNGSIQTLAVDFEQHCEGATPALSGSVRYNSIVSVVPRVSVADATALKGNSGTNDATVAISLSLPSNQLVSVRYSTANGTAVRGRQYTASAGRVTFEPGTTSHTITVPLIGDRLPGGNKFFHLSLSYPSGAPIGDGSAIVNILDPNVPLTALSMYGQAGDYISPGQLLLTAADGSFNTTRNFDQGVSLTLNSGNSWNLDFAGYGNSPLAAGNYEKAQRFPFQPTGSPGLSVSGAGRGCNTLTGRFDVLAASYLPNGNVRSFAADFEQHCEGAAPGLFGSMSINASWRQLSVTNAVVDSLESKAVFTVTLNPASNGTVWVNFNTVDGTAIAGGDYYATSETIRFAPGETQHKVTVPLVIPTKDGPDKKFFGQISGPSGAPVWISQGSAVI
ncbi:MAG TPA: Calx-beta domain-containing protein [Candidatus Acidoferrum sp.]